MCIYIMLTFSVDCSLNLKLCAQFGGGVKLRSVCVGVGVGGEMGRKELKRSGKHFFNIYTYIYNML